MPDLGRRRFLLRSTAVAASAGLPLTLAFSRRARAENPWGSPVADPTGHLSVPPGFTVTVLQNTGEVMSDGYRVPDLADGMACFPGPQPNQIVLMRNHELGTDVEGSAVEGQSQPSEVYDPLAYGAVTRVVVDLDTMSVVSSNLVLQGTRRNCAGGASPWGWLSCEEEVNPGDQPHGYVFRCDVNAESVQAPDPIPAYGRFYHEAVAIDPSNNVAYLTEDRADSALYRFVPDDPGAPFVGTLQAMAVKGQPGFATTNMATGDIVEIEWVDIDEPDPPLDTVRNEAHDKGAAFVIRGEGIAFHEGQVYVCSTNGGTRFLGQIFRLIDGDDGGTLELVAQADDDTELDMPDNIIVASNGDVYIVEDGADEQYIRFIDDTGTVRTFGQNVLNNSELAGVCFSPDHRHMFVNIHQPGVTLAVTGPFVGPQEGDTDGDGDETGDETGGTAGAGSGNDDGCACDSAGSGGDVGLGVAGTLVAAAALRGVTAGRQRGEAASCDRVETSDSRSAKAPTAPTSDGE